MGNIDINKIESMTNDELYNYYFANRMSFAQIIFGAFSFLGVLVKINDLGSSFFANILKIILAGVVLFYLWKLYGRIKYNVYLWKKSKIIDWILHRIIWIVIGTFISLFTHGYTFLILPLIVVAFFDKFNYLKENFKYIKYQLFGFGALILGLIATFMVFTFGLGGGLGSNPKVAIPIGIFIIIAIFTGVFMAIDYLQTKAMKEDQKANVNFYLSYRKDFIVPFLFWSLASGFIHSSMFTQDDVEAGFDAVDDINNYAYHETSIHDNNATENYGQNYDGGINEHNLHETSLNNNVVLNAGYADVKYESVFPSGFDISVTPFASNSDIVSNPYEMLSVFNTQQHTVNEMDTYPEATDTSFASKLSNPNGETIFTINENNEIFDNLNQPMGKIVNDPTIENTRSFVNTQGDEILTARTNGNDTQFFGQDHYLGHISRNAKGVETLRDANEGIRIIKHANGSLFDANGKPLGKMS